MIQGSGSKSPSSAKKRHSPTTNRIGRTDKETGGDHNSHFLWTIRLSVKMSATMVMEMIMPAPVETQIEMPDESRDTRISESMPTSDKVEEKCCNVMTVEEEDTCDKGQQNTVQKLLAESTAAIAKLSTHQPNSTGNQEDELVSTPSRTTGVSEEEEENVQQRLAPR